MADQKPTQFIDYCSNGCKPDSAMITPWVGEICGCCGGKWGYLPTGECRGIHINGAIWAELLDAEGVI